MENVPGDYFLRLTGGGGVFMYLELRRGSTQPE